MNQKVKITIIAFLYLLFIGLCGGSLGVIILPIAKDLGVEVADVAAQFSIFSLGSTLFIIATTGVVVKYLSIRKSIIVSAIFLIFGSLAIFNASSVMMLAASFLFFGFGVGMSYSLGQYFIISLYEGKQRNSKISLLNFFYSAGAVISPLIGAYMINTLAISWRVIFTGTALVVLINAILALSTDFSVIDIKSREEKEKQDKEKSEVDEKSIKEQFKEIPFAAYIVVLSVFIYSMSEVSLTTWLVPYSQEVAGVDPVIAGALFSTFWLFVGIGRFLSTFILERIKGEVYLIGMSTYTAIIVTIFVILGKNISNYTGVMMALLGFGYSALLAVINSYGTLQVRGKNRMLVTILLGVGSCGPIVAPMVSSKIQKTFGYAGVVYSSAGFMICVAVLLTLSVIINKARNYNPYEKC